MYPSHKREGTASLSLHLVLFKWNDAEELRRLDGCRFRKDAVDGRAFVFGWRSAGGRKALGVAQRPRNGGKRVEMIGAGGFGCQQQKHQVHRRIIDGLKRNRFFQAREEALNFIKPGQASMRNGEPLADAGGAEFLALPQYVENDMRFMAREAGGVLRNGLQRVLFGAGLEARP